MSFSGGAPPLSASAMRISERQRSFKKGIDADTTRRRREDATVQIRKTKKEDRLNQRRRMNSTAEYITFDSNMDISDSSAAGTSTGGGNSTSTASAPTSSTHSVSLQDLPKIAARIQSLDPMEQTAAVSKLRRLLSLETNPPIQDVINLGVVPLLVNFLRLHDKPELQFEAAWALTNVASGTSAHTQTVIASGAVPVLCELLLSSNDDVCEQAVWALGNISGDSFECRDLVLQAGAMMPLLAVLRRSSNKLSLLRNATWALSNFCRGKPKPAFDLVSPALMLLPHLIYSSDEEVATDACWTLSYLSDGRTDAIQAVMDAGVCSKVVDLVGHSLTAIQTPALRTIGNIVTGDAHQTQAMLDLGVLLRLVPLLRHEKKLIRKEACWAISNITAGSTSQIQEVLDAGVIPLLLFQLQSNAFEVRKEAAWAIANATSGGTPAQMQFLVQQGCIPPLVSLLETPDNQVINVALDALENILRLGEAERTIDGDNTMALCIEEADGVELLQNLQYHQNEELYEKANRLIRDYFDGEDDDDDVDDDDDDDDSAFDFDVPATAQQQQFAFPARSSLTSMPPMHPHPRQLQDRRQFDF